LSAAIHPGAQFEQIADALFVQPLAMRDFVEDQHARRCALNQKQNARVNVAVVKA
jgi:hypothetical protein